jgi:hypothetical protein
VTEGMPTPISEDDIVQALAYNHGKLLVENRTFLKDFTIDSLYGSYQCSDGSYINLPEEHGQLSLSLVFRNCQFNMSLSFDFSDISQLGFVNCSFGGQDFGGETLSFQYCKINHLVVANSVVNSVFHYQSEDDNDGAILDLAWSKFNGPIWINGCAPLVIVVDASQTQQFHWASPSSRLNVEYARDWPKNYNLEWLDKQLPKFTE